MISSITPFFVLYLFTASNYCLNMDKQREEILDKFHVCSYGKQCLFFDKNYQCINIILYSCNSRVRKEWQRLSLFIQHMYRVSQLSKLYPTYYSGRQAVAQCQYPAVAQRSTLSMVKPYGHPGPHVGLIN